MKYELRGGSTGLVFAKIEEDETILTNDHERCKFAEESLILALDCFKLIKNPTEEVNLVIKQINKFINTPF